jgi:hypothetical protein
MRSICALYIKARYLNSCLMFGLSVHPDAQSAPVECCANTGSEEEDLLNLQEQQHLASELARLLSLHESDGGDTPHTHAEIRAWLQELLHYNISTNTTPETRNKLPVNSCI